MGARLLIEVFAGGIALVVDQGGDNDIQRKWAKPKDI